MNITTNLISNNNLNYIIKNYINNEIKNDYENFLEELYKNILISEIKEICYDRTKDAIYYFNNEIYLAKQNNFFNTFKNLEFCAKNEINTFSKNFDIYKLKIIEEDLFYLKMKYDFEIYEGFWNFKDEIKIYFNI